MTDPAIMWYLNLAAFVGGLMLAVPVLSLNARKREFSGLVSELRKLKQIDSQGLATAMAEVQTTDAADAVAKWRWLDQFCLYVGYGLLLGSAGLLLVL